MPHPRFDPVVALGVLNALEQIVAPESLRAAVRRRVPDRFQAPNEEALEKGRERAPTAENPWASSTPSGPASLR